MHFIIEMILGTIPRSWRAAAALAVLWLGAGWMLTGLQDLVMPDSEGYTGGGLAFGCGLLLTIASGVAFYYWQHMDGEGRRYNELDTLNKAYEHDEREKRIRQNAATPVFSSHEGEHVPVAGTEPKDRLPTA